MQLDAGSYRFSIADKVSTAPVLNMRSMKAYAGQYVALGARPEDDTVFSVSRGAFVCKGNTVNFVKSKRHGK